ncbi:HNH endonuclease [Virgibacillus sp. FSP13]
MERDGYRCHYCGSYGDTIDHKVPRAKGGARTPSNCVCACIECNRYKDDMEYKEYIDNMVLTIQG